jgi:hypothetical protein
MWNLLIYNFLDERIESEIFHDLTRLTQINFNYSNVIVNILIGTESFGFYKIKIRGNPFTQGIQMWRQDSADMSKRETFVSFLTSSLDNTTDQTALIMSGHGSGWLQTIKKGTIFPIAAMAQYLREAKIKLDLVCLDCCLLGNISTMYELRDLADVIVAYEDYIGMHGIIQPRTLLHFETNVSARDLAIHLVTDLFQVSRETDITVISTHEIEALAKYLQMICPLKRPRTNDLCIDPDYWQLQDLYSIVIGTLEESERFQHTRAIQIQKFQELFDKVVIWYRQTPDKHNPRHHGLSCIVDADIDTYDTQQSWRGLQLHLTYE